jgi:hypothetical protein
VVIREDGHQIGDKAETLLDSFRNRLEAYGAVAIVNGAKSVSAVVLILFFLSLVSDSISVRTIGAFAHR